MALSLQRTLGELRATLAARLGFGGMGAGVNTPHLNALLAEAQEELYEQFDWPILRTVWPLTLGVGQRWLDYPDGANPDRIREVRVHYATQWYPLTEGIESEHDSDRDDYTTWPSRFDRRAQLEFWPLPDQVYEIEVEGIRELSPFTQDGHRATVDDRTLLLRAVVDGKAHYGQRDARLYEERLMRITRRLRGRVHGQKRYTAGPMRPLPRIRPVLTP